MDTQKPVLLQGAKHQYLFYPYQKEFIISNGRFAKVHPAIMLPSKQKVIIKQLHQGLVSNEESRFRFLLEASVQLNNSSVVQNIDFIANDNGMFLIQEYVDGVDFHKYISSRRCSRQTREKEIIKTVVAVLDSLVVVHNAGYFHCGIKPSSVFITRAADEENNFPDVKIIDFALCQSQQVIPEIRSKARIPYNIKYSAPELLLNHLNLVNASTDLFSLGIMLYEYIAGIAPHKSINPIQMVQMQVSAPIPVHDNISNEVMSVILRACEKPVFRKPPGAYSYTETTELIADSMQYRYQNCREMAVDLIKLI
ncbi:MAG TPA: protein kinase [Bacteroidales bacterium]|nr:protein kinase [Bacteroidales bacterium]